MAAIRIYLAWQRIADGRVQIRKWSPDMISPAGEHLFLGFQSQTKEALTWLADNGEPTWPECLATETPKSPFIVQVDEGQFVAWKLSRSRELINRPRGIGVHQQMMGRANRISDGEPYLIINEAATVNEDALAGVMRILKQHKGE